MLRTHKLSERHANGAGSSRWSTISHLTPPHLCRPVARHALSCDTPNPTQHSTYDYCRPKRIRRHQAPTRHRSALLQGQKNWTRMYTDLADGCGSRRSFVTATQHAQASLRSIRQIRENPRPIRRPLNPSTPQPLTT